jgi:chemotaxis protein MotA
MLAIIGIVVVIVSILGGYLIEAGPLHVLWQPAEFIIILGAAAGILIVGNPAKTLKGIGAALPHIFTGGGMEKGVFQDALAALYELFMVGKKNGLLALEEDVGHPEKSAIFNRHRTFLVHQEAVHFLCDTLKLMIDGSSKMDEIETAMDTEIETAHEAAMQPVNALARVADALPGMGIVAAVMGVVIAVQGIDGPPEEIGKKVGAALVGTFLGILMSYGFIGPMATKMEHLAKDDERMLMVIKTAVVAFGNGAPPAAAVDLARRVIYPETRPSSGELTTVIKAVKKAEAA